MDDEEDLNVFQPAHPDYFDYHPEHRWEAEKFGMSLFDVFTKLPKQFNLMALPILDRESFVLETQHVSLVARDRAEFYQLLESKLQARRKGTDQDDDARTLASHSRSEADGFARPGD